MNILNRAITRRAVARRSNLQRTDFQFRGLLRQSLRSFLAMTFVLVTSCLIAHPKSSLLWKITGNGLKSPSYLYGTVHSFDNRAFTFAKLAESRIAQCDAFG